MMNLFYEPLPDSIPVGGSACKILTDFRDWLKFCDMVKDDALTPYDKLDFMRNWFLKIPDCMTEEMCRGLKEFCEVKALEPDKPEEAEREGFTKPPTFDWCIDAKYVIADFRRFYTIDLLSVEYMHWWEFFSLMKALPDESQMYRRISIRTTDLSKIKEPERKRAVMEAQMRIAIPFEMDDFAIGAAFGMQ